MFNSNFISPNAKDALANHKREQEERKLAMIREQKLHELKQLETQFFYKKQEVARLKTVYDRLKREAVTRQGTDLREQRELQIQEDQLKDTESRIKALDQKIHASASELNDKIEKEKMLIQEHQRKLDQLEKEKQTTESKQETEKRSLKESVSRILFFKKRKTTQSEAAHKFFQNTEAQIKQTELALKSFTEETHVLENKIRALKSTIK